MVHILVCYTDHADVFAYAVDATQRHSLWLVFASWLYRYSGAVCAYRLDHEALRCRAYVSLIQHRECCCYGTIVTGVPTLTFE